MTATSTKKAIKGYECKHAIYSQAEDGSPHDLLVIKEIIHYEDGTTEPNLRMIKDYKRDFWVTKEGHRNHKDKKEWEDVGKLQKFTTNQAQLPRRIVGALGYGQATSLRRLARSQYLYGCDVTTPVLIKQKYMAQYPNVQSKNAVAVLDIETDVNYGHGDILSISLTFKDRCICVVTKDFMRGVPNPVESIYQKFDEYLHDDIVERGINLEVLLVDSPGQAIIEIFKRAHAWKPDFIAVWNINYDLPKILTALEKENIDARDVFCDPSVPENFRGVRWQEGPSQKVTATGKITPMHPADRWHTMHCPASFYLIDSMCVYKKIRAAKGNESSYALDHILNKKLGRRKLKFEQANQYVGLKWHQVMQAQYKPEYCVYNIFDCIGVELLDDKERDLQMTISTLVGYSEYSRFPSQPRRTVDDLHFFCLDRGKVIATTSDQMTDENDDLVVSMVGWIVTLASHLVDDNGIAAIRELPDVRSYIRTHVFDLDVSAAYPNAQDILNISKETTYRELSRIEGVSETAQRKASINMTGGTTNAVEICRTIYGAPSLDQLLQSFKEESSIPS